MNGENLVFVLFENFSIKAFHYIFENGSYSFDDMYSCSVPYLWRKDSLARQLIIDDVLNFLIQKFNLKMQDVSFKIVTDDSDMVNIKHDERTSIYVRSKKDISLVPYFSSSYLESIHLAFANLKYYSMDFIDNQGGEVYSKWNEWKEIGEIVNKSLGGSDRVMTEKWLNNLIRPVIASQSFYIASTAGLMLSTSDAMLPQNAKSGTILAGGELFSWLSKREDIIFPFLIGLKSVPSILSIYQDSINIMGISKPLRDISLKLLEQSSGRFIRHVGDVISIKSNKKSVKSSIVVGKVDILDDDGFKSFYPVSEDILVVRIKGIGNVSLDLHNPFFIANGENKFKVRDILVIDTRIVNRDNIMNFNSWYDRMKIV